MANDEADSLLSSMAASKGGMDSSDIDCIGGDDDVAVSVGAVTSLVTSPAVAAATASPQALPNFWDEVECNVLDPKVLP